VLAWFGAFVISGTKLSELLPSITKFGAVSLIVWVSWLAFTKRLWRSRLASGWLVTTPYLGGRWVGEYVSVFDKIKRGMTLEIGRTLLKLECTSFTIDSVGEIYIARPLSDHDDQSFKLVYVYHAKRNQTTSVPGDEHEGLVILRLIDGPPMSLKGFYVNDRHPTQSKGDIELTWESEHRLKHF
jgi:hypothetical protein